MTTNPRLQQWDAAVGHDGDDASLPRVAVVAPRQNRATIVNRKVLNDAREAAHAIATDIFATGTKHLKQEHIAAEWGTTRQYVGKVKEGDLAWTGRDLIATGDAKAIESVSDQLRAVAKVMKSASKKQPRVRDLTPVALDSEIVNLAERLGEIAKRHRESREENSPAGPKRSQTERDHILEGLEKLISDAQRLHEAVRNEPVEH